MLRRVVCRHLLLRVAESSEEELPLPEGVKDAAREAAMKIADAVAARVTAYGGVPSPEEHAAPDDTRAVGMDAGRGGSWVLSAARACGEDEWAGWEGEVAG